MITTLIDKQDTFEIVRDQIAQILANEIASQQILATDSGQSPEGWDLKIFAERSNPWEQFLNDDKQNPVVNVWHDSSNFDKSASNVVERQKSQTVYNIDCYGFGRAAADPTCGGHTPGDLDAAKEAQRAVRLARNILMAATYTYLGLRGTVWSRWTQTIQSFQPEIDGRRVQQVLGVRLALAVEFSEFSPQVEPGQVCEVSVTINRAEDGSVLAEAEYDYT